jgi:hypothetical protein
MGVFSSEDIVAVGGMGEHQREQKNSPYEQ